MFEALKTWVANLRRGDVTALPPEGRSSVEATLGSNIASALGAYKTVSPVVDFEMLALLRRLYVFNPDVSQFVTNIINLGNTGHQITVDAKSGAKAEATLIRLNEAASRLYRGGAGVDGLINGYLAQIAWSGALSSEDVVNLAARRVERIVFVPVEQIRFEYEDGDYAAYQQTGLLAARAGTSINKVRLNPETYRYYALTTIENSPYAKPPASAAVAAITGAQADMIDNLKYIAKKFGILGLVSVACTPPPKRPHETENQYTARTSDYIRAVRNNLDGNFNKGLMVTFKDQAVSHTNVAAGAQGFYDVFRVNEEQVMSGLGMQPAFFGRTDSTTETYADVVYNLLLAQVGNIQRLVKRRQEATYRLDLRLEGIEVDSLSIGFNRAHSRDPLKEAQADEVRYRVAAGKARDGIISPDEAAQELGYEAAHDASVLTGSKELSRDAARELKAHKGAGCAESFSAVFRFDAGSQKYRFKSSVIELATSIGAVKPQAGQRSFAALSEAEINALLDDFIAKYLTAMQPLSEAARDAAIAQVRAFLQRSTSGDFTDADDFAAKVFEQVESAYTATFTSSRARGSVKKTTRAVYDFYRLKDETPFGDKSPVKLAFGAPDTRSVNFFNKLDNFYFSTFLDNRSQPVKDFIREEYLERGAALFGRGTSEDLDDFRKAVGGKLDNMNDYAVETIVVSSVQRIRNHAHVLSLAQAKIKLARIEATIDERTSEICDFLNGKLVRVGAAAETVDRLAQFEPGEYAVEMYKGTTGKAYAQDPVGYVKDRIDKDGVMNDDLVKEGRFPPLHPRCRTRLSGVFKK